ncbi:MAG TPA: DUF3160 domain-containing protein [Polyangia bacterium]|nr:DUF3160 domain-containing protein [Polyangia bacterium]
MKCLSLLGCVAVLACAKSPATNEPGPVGGGGTAGTSGGVSGAGTVATSGGTAGTVTASGGAAGGGAISTSTYPALTGPWSSNPAPADKASQKAQLAALTTLTTDGLVARSTGAMNQPLGYAPESAAWFDLIQASVLALNAQELVAYKKNGFVISQRQSYANFFSGYATIYASDLPIYVSADSILYALHRSYDRILMNVESGYLSPTLKQLLAGLRTGIATAAISDNSKHDLGLLLGVAAGLVDPQATGLDAEMQALIAKATAATGIETVTLFGTDRAIDFSQFTPRGHYNDGWTMAQYFRAMMWLGRTELRLVDVQANGTRVLVRREVEDVLALGQLLASDLRAQWNSIEQIVALFVGEADYMTLPQVQQLQDALGLAASTDLASIADQKLLDTIDAGNYGVQRICSQLMEVDDGVTTLPNSFAFLGQRYTVDSHVFAKVVYPNTQTRMMPNPLDVAFAAFGNDQAAPLLRSELDAYAYAPSLGKARQLVEWHDANYWDSSLYTFWVSALRQLSGGSFDATTLPAIARTEQWGRRLLNTQLGSWAELRHDTLLYAKQSYTGIPVCEYPDGYVDPYPGLFGRLRQLGTVAADKLAAVLPATNGADSAPVSYFRTFADVASRLETMANEELAGATRTQADLDFLNDTVVVKRQSAGCTTINVPSGWYAKLFYQGDDALDANPIIADVHTQPADAAGNIVGKVLHVATGSPRLMVLSVDSCLGPRAYAGVVSSYFEQITENFKRMTDQEWATQISAATPADVPWMQDLVVR